MRIPGVKLVLKEFSRVSYLTLLYARKQLENRMFGLSVQKKQSRVPDHSPSVTVILTGFSAKHS